MQATHDETTPLLTPDLLDLLAKSTAVRRGLAFVHRAPPECVAATLGVHAHTVDRVRDYLDRAQLREMVIREYVRLRERHRTEPPPPAPSNEPPALREALGPEDLIRAAEQHPLGVKMIVCSPLETLAITFGVHPNVAAEAREMLARRGVIADESDEP